MTSEEIKAVIERLGAYCNSTYDVMLAFMNYGNSADYGCTEFKGVLVDLLKQADPDTHIELPTGSDGVPIHVGDEVCGLDHPNGGVYCHAIIDPCAIAVGDIGDYANSKGWALWNTLDVCRYHKPTVESVLTEYAEIVRNVRGSDVESVVNECASKIKELMKDEN